MKSKFLLVFFLVAILSFAAVCLFNGARNAVKPDRVTLEDVK